MKIITNFKKSIFCVAVLSFLISSCSEQRYTYYNIDKKKDTEVELKKPSALNVNTVKVKEPVALENKEVAIEPVAEISPKKEILGAKAKTSNGKAVKRVTNAIDQSLTAPLKTFAKIPAKLNTTFSKHKDTATLNEEGRGGLIWTIIVIVLILWLLGFLVGDLGGLIHLLLVVALVLIILHLLGVI